MTLTAQYRPYRDEDGADIEPNGWHEQEPSIQIYEKTTETMPYAYRKRSLIWILFFTAFAGLFGFIIGILSHANSSECVHTKVISALMPSSSSASNEQESTLIRAQILASISSDNIRQHVREFSKAPHLASSVEDLNLALKVADFFKSNHFDRTIFKNYTALLSLPDSNRPNSVSIIDGTGHEVYSSPKSFSSQLPFYSPYSPSGNVTGEVLFVNYGRPVDYLQLQSLFNTTSNEIFNGKIFLAKQFHLSASEQYKYAVALNASALLLYPDPQHYNPQNQKSFPDSTWLPSDGVRSDGIFWNGAGDPETFGLPSNSYAFRNKFDEQMTIPAQPISSDTAFEILKHMDGIAAPRDWSGGFNLKYHLGPNLKDNFKVRVIVNNRLVRKTIYNVIGTIRGEKEPDRYVLIGNQRDSMTHGAVDSASGTGTFLEIARVFGNLVEKGLRPKRSLVFCSWGAEEFNLIGSTEFVEDTFKILYMRAVAYINVNLVVNGNDTLSVAASPLLYHSIYNATKNVFLPENNLQPGGESASNNEFNSIYDKWVVSMPKMRNKSTLVFQPNLFNHLDDIYGVDNEKLTEEELERDHHFFHQHEISDPGCILKAYLESAFQEVRPHVRQLDMYGSYAPFFTMAGIPVLDICFINIDPEDKLDSEHNEDFEKISFDHLPYPLLHTQYDKIEAVEQFIDPDYQYHVTIAQLLTHIIEQMANSLFLPFNIFDYAQVLNDFYLKTKHMHNVVMMGNKNDAFGFWDSSIHQQQQSSDSQFRDTESRLPFDPDMMDIDLRSLESAIKNFTREAVKFHAQQDKIDFKNPMMVRQINDKLLLIERQFLDHRGIPNNNLKRHLILSPAETLNSQVKNDGLFPALLDELDQIMGTVYREDIQHSLIRLQKHLPILINTIQEAANSLSINGDFV